MSSKDYYALLGIKENATDGEIKKAYSFSRKLNPRSRRKKYEVTDPGYYDQLIYDQKNRCVKTKQTLMSGWS